MSNSGFTFFDFCAGIGAGHTALTSLGGKCVGFSEINKKSEITYREIHKVNKNELKNWGDLTKMHIKEAPDFDVMIGGFPCQTFSIIGQRKGMKDERGQIIFSLARILKEKEVKFFLLENVKGLVNHDRGRTIAEVLKLLRGAGYKVDWKVLKSSNYGIPQIRERVYFVGVRKDLVSDNFKFSFPTPLKNKKKLNEFLIDEDPALLFKKNNSAWNTFTHYLQNKYNIGLYDLDKLLKEDYLILDTRQSDLRLYRNNCPTLRTGRHGLLYIKNGEIRRLSSKEGLLLQGFNIQQAESVKVANQTDLLSQAGNAFTVNVISELIKEMLAQMPFNKTYISNKPKLRNYGKIELNIIKSSNYGYCRQN